jgi:hypothetical protein
MLWSHRELTLSLDKVDAEELAAVELLGEVQDAAKLSRWNLHRDANIRLICAPL